MNKKLKELEKEYKEFGKMKGSDVNKEVVRKIINLEARIRKLKKANSEDQE